MGRRTTGQVDVDVTTAEDEEAMAETLSQLGQALQEAATKKRGGAKVIGQLTDLLSRLSVKDYPELADHPVVAQFLETVATSKARNSDDPPGTVYNKGTLAEHKKPWQWRDLKDFPTITFTPLENAELYYNGLGPVYLTADVECTVHEVFYGIYMESRRQQRFGREHMAWLMRRRDAPSHPDMITVEAIKARASGDGAHYLPGGGVIMGRTEPDASGGEGGKEES